MEQPPMAVTLHEVARLAGVSTTTASDALRQAGRVSARTRHSVLEAARHLNYVPNGSARSLRRGATATIGLHLPEVLTRSEYYMSFVFGVVELAGRRHHDVRLITSGRLPGAEGSPGVDGLVLGDPLQHDDVVGLLLEARVPIVTCERYPDSSAAAGVVTSDHAATVGALLDHLAERGAHRPALIGSSRSSDWADTVLRAYLAWCEQRRLEPLARELPFGSDAARVRHETGDLLQVHPDLDALVCVADGAAAAALPVLRAGGRTVGGDVLLASCVDSTAMRLADPPITAIDLRPREAGAACAELLFDLIGGVEQPGATRLVPVGLELRESTGPPS